MTVNELIRRSMRLLNELGTGEAMEAAVAEDGLSVLNSLVESLGNEGLLIYAQSTNNIPLIVNQASVTVGPSGAVVTERPVEVLASSYILTGTLSTPLQILTAQAYSDIGLKADAGPPVALFPLMGLPNATMFIWPVPSVACTLILNSNKRLQTFTLIDNTIVMPDGYEKMLAYNLAVDLAPEFGVKLSRDILTGAANSKRILKRTNTQVPFLGMPSAVMGNGLYR